jgi:hypothetical protein
MQLLYAPKLTEYIIPYYKSVTNSASAHPLSRLLPHFDARYASTSSISTRRAARSSFTRDALCHVYGPGIQLPPPSVTGRIEEYDEYNGPPCESIIFYFEYRQRGNFRIPGPGFVFGQEKKRMGIYGLDFDGAGEIGHPVISRTCIPAVGCSRHH